MNKSLGWIGAIGLTLCVVFLGLAFAKGADTFPWLRGFGNGNWFNGFDADFVGDKPVATASGMKQWAWNGDHIEIDIPAQVRVVPSDSGASGVAAITVRGPQDMVDKVRFSNGKLALASHQSSFRDKQHLEVTLRGTFKQYVMAVGKLELGHIDQDKLSVRISGAGGVDGEGRVTDLDLAISGVGNAELGKLAAQDAHVEISGAGNAEISASGQADVSLSGVGNVSLLTQPKKLVTHISGLGHVEGPDGGRMRDRDDD